VVWEFGQTLIAPKFIGWAPDPTEKLVPSVVSWEGVAMGTLLEFTIVNAMMLAAGNCPMGTLVAALFVA